MRAVIYARVSYDDRDNDGRNLEGQLEMGREYCKGKGYDVIDKLAEDAKGASGAEIDLPQLNKVLKMAREGKFDVLVVRSLDRLARDALKYLLVREQLRKDNVTVEYCKQQFSDSPDGKMMETILASFAQLEREYIAARTKRGKRNTVLAGYVLVSTGAPYGYRAIREMIGEKRQHAILEVSPVEAEIVRLIFHWFAVEALSINSIVKRLDAMGAPAPISAGRKRKEGWPRCTIRGILRNTTYKGEWKYVYDCSEPLVVKVPEIIKPELWSEAQVMLNWNKERVAKAPRYEYLLNRRMVCGKCGKIMKCFPQNSRGRLHLYYVCSGSCKKMRVRVDKVDTLAWNWLSSILGDDKKLANDLYFYHRTTSDRNQPLMEQLTMYNALVAENEARLQRLMHLYLNGAFPKEALDKESTKINETLIEQRTRQAELKALLEADTLRPEQITGILSFVATFRQSFVDATHQQKKQLFSALNVSGMLNVDDSQKTFQVRCAFRSKAETVKIFDIPS